MLGRGKLMDYSIKIDKFEGPLDLLLHLIKESNINIYDISIDDITKQYLDYINKMEELNINIASSYLVMAAELMELKSKFLLPIRNDEQDSEDEYEENTRENLIHRLLEYQKYKEISNTFKELELSRRQIYIKEPENISKYLEGSLPESNLTALDLLEAMQKFLDRKEKEKPLNTKITSKEYSVKERKKEIREFLQNKDKIEFTELFNICTKSYVIVTFLSILEMSKEKEININQERNFSNIYIELRRS
jgi:segregation and condensation protein A